MGELFSRESLKYLPLVAWGLGRAALEMAIKPIVTNIVDSFTAPSQEDLDEMIAETIRAYNAGLEAVIPEIEG